ncbi:MAG: lantibiotic dehydratase [Hyalangium sp.]|uniref:lantibiotic dehydratase n=1 Tax=Hyalangium sp. TaxID=2028555 RepID=UPI00389AAC96
MATSTTSHVVPLSSEWSVWSTVVLRSTGFPITWLARLAGTGAPAAADRLLAHEELRQEARAAADALLANKLAQGGEGRGLLAKLRDQIARGALRSPEHPDPVVAAALARVQASEAEVARLREEARAAWRTDTLRCQAVLREIASDARFREAMLWQSRSALRGSVDAFLRRPPGEMDSKTREYERLITRYVQRYCAKNDTIGFFGPVGWATVNAEAEALTVRPGDSLLRARNVYLEHWCVDAVAEALGRDPELRPLLAPRRMPSTRLEGDTLHYGIGKTVSVSPAVRRTLELCDGSVPARELAQRLAQEPQLEVSEADVLELLGDLAERSVIAWTVEVAPGTPRPEALVEEALARLPEGAARSRALEAMRTLSATREQVKEAAGDTTKLDAALDAMDGVFVQLTGQQAQRSAGKAYAGRTLLYEDCVRNVDAELGAAVVARLGPPMALLLRSARWFTWELSSRYVRALEGVHARLAAELGSREVPFLTFYEKTLELFPTDPRRPSAITAEVCSELQARWLSVLALPAGASRVERSARELEGRVEEAFSAPGPGWPEARYHSPDIMIAAKDLDAIARGDYLVVLGELHAGTNTLFSFCMLKEHPQPEELIRARCMDVPERCVETVAPKEAWGRADNFSHAPHDVEVELGATRAWRPREQVEAAADLFVVQEGGKLRVESRKTGRRFEAAEFFGNPMRYESTYFFHPLPKMKHGPRITVDGTVLAREHWRFEPSELTFPETPDARFLAARQWARAHRIPRFAFFSIPEERKPFFVDFDSPALVEMAWHMLRRASSVTVSEMLPSPDEAWLPDAQGERYCCELRLAAVDERRWKP